VIGAFRAPRSSAAESAETMIIPVLMRRLIVPAGKSR